MKNLAHACASQRTLAVDFSLIFSIFLAFFNLYFLRILSNFLSVGVLISLSWCRGSRRLFRGSRIPDHGRINVVAATTIYLLKFSNHVLSVWKELTFLRGSFSRSVGFGYVWASHDALINYLILIII